MSIAFSIIFFIVIRLISKRIYRAAEVTVEKSYLINRHRKNMLKSQLHRKRVLKLENGKTSRIFNKVETLGTSTIDKEQKKFKEEERDEGSLLNLENDNVSDQEIIDQDTSTGDGWICVVKRKRRKKGRNLKESRTIGAKNTSSKSFSIDQPNLEKSSAIDMNEGTVKEDKGKKGRLSKSILIGDKRSKTCTDSASSSLRKLKNTCSLANDVDNAIKEKCSLENQCLKYDVKLKTDTCSTQFIDNVKKVSTESSTLSVVQESSSVESSTVNKTSRNVVSTKLARMRGKILQIQQSTDKVSVVYPPGMGFHQVINIPSDNYCRKLVQSGESMRCDNIRYSDNTILYKKVAMEFCSKLHKLRQLHSTYCMKLIHQIFKVEDGNLVVSDDVKNFFSQHTKNTKVLFFVIKVSLIVSIGTLYGGKEIADYMRYCAGYFYDQSLLDRLILNLIKFSSEKLYVTSKNINIIFDCYCRYICSVPYSEPYSGRFFQEVFDICSNLTLVEKCGEYEELMDFAILSCIIHCGNMVSMLCKMLIDDPAVANSKGNLIIDRMKAFIFCQECYDVKKAVVHIYHPMKGEMPHSIGDVMNLPLVVWRTCTKNVDNIVKTAFEEGNLSFGIFVKEMTYRARKLILNPSTRGFYKNDIEQYSYKLKTASSVLFCDEIIDIAECEARSL